MNYQIKTPHITLEYTPETTALSVTVNSRDITWKTANIPFIVLGDKSVAFTDAKCESHAYQTGVSQGIRTVYSQFTDADGTVYPFSVETDVSVNHATGFVKVEARVEGDGKGTSTAAI